MKQNRIQVGDIALNYSLSGPVDAPVISLNHCFSGDHRYWDHHLTAFEGFRVLRHDTRGHGGSDTPSGPYTLAMMASDLLGLLDLLDISRVHLCGVSMGGMISQNLAIAAPERVASLALVNPQVSADCSKASTEGHVQTRFRSPKGLSTRSTGGQNLRALNQSTG